MYFFFSHSFGAIYLSIYVHVLDIYTQINRRIFTLHYIFFYINQVAFIQGFLSRTLPLFDFDPPENTNELTLARTRKFSGGAEGGAEVKRQVNLFT